MTPEPLNTLAKALLDGERAAPSGAEPDAGAAERILGRLEALGLPPATAPAASSGVAAQAAVSVASKVGSHLLMLVLGAGLGVGGTLVATRSTPVVNLPVPTPVVPAPIPEAHVVEPPPAPVPLAPQPEPVKVAAAPPAVKSLLKNEQVLLDTARAAMLNRRFDEALEALELHATRYPAGVLMEEREALFVQALAASGRAEEARARAARFTKRFPTSIFLPAVDASLELLHE